MLCGGLAVTGEHHHPDALPVQRSNGVSAGFLNRVGHGDQPQRFASGGKVHGRLPLRGQRVCLFRQCGDIHAVFLHKPAVARQHRHAGADGPDSPAGEVFKFIRLAGKIQSSVLRRLDDGRRQRMLGHGLHRRRDGQQAVGSAAYGADLRHRRLALGHGAGLVQHHRIDGMGHFQNFAGADEDAVSGSQPRAYHNGRGGGQPQRAGAGDHQHRREHPQDKGEVLPRHSPDHRRQHSKADDRGNENTGNLVCRPGDRGLFALRVLHKADDPGQGGVLSHTGDLHIQHAVFIDAAADDLAARRLFHRQALAGEHGLVDAALTFRHHAVQRNPGAGLYQQHVPGLDRGRGYLLAAVR